MKKYKSFHISKYHRIIIIATKVVTMVTMSIFSELPNVKQDI